MEKCSLTLYPKQQWEIWKPGKPGKLGKPGTADPQLTSTKFLQLRHPSIQQTSSQTHGELWPSSESVSVLHFLHFIILITWHPVDTTSISCFILLVPGFVRASAEFLQHHSSHGASGLSPNAFAQLDWIEDDEDVGCSRERERESCLRKLFQVNVVMFCWGILRLLQLCSLLAIKALDTFYLLHLWLTPKFHRSSMSWDDRRRCYEMLRVHIGEWSKVCYHASVCL